MKIADRGGCTALHRAAARGHLGVLQDLLPHGMIEVRDAAGHTALHLAALEMQEEACGLLAEAGADLANCINNAGERAVEGMPERLLQRLG